MHGFPIAIYCVLAGVVLGIIGSTARATTAVLAVLGIAILFRRNPRYALMGCVLLGLGAGGLAAQTADRENAIEELAPAWCRIDGHVLERAGGLGTLVGVDRAECGSRIVGAAGAIVMDGEIAESGAIVEAEGYLDRLRERDFDDARERAGADAAFEASWFEIEPPTARAHVVAGRARGALVDALGGVEDERAALLRGLTIGETDGLAPATEERVRRAGLSHLVAVSGSNVALVLGATMWATNRLPRAVRHLIAAMMLSLFVLVVGPEPSVLRAATMGVVTLVALTASVRTEPLGALGAALVILLILRPGILYAVGLHLSVAATVGIVVFTKPLLARMENLPRPIALLLAATLAAQIAVAPVLIGVFGELSIVAPLANLLALGAVPPATVAAAAAGLAHVLVPAAGVAIASLAEPFAWWILSVARLGDLSWAAVEVPTSWAWPAGALVVLATTRVIAAEITTPLRSLNE